MRRIAAFIEGLAATPFILFVGLVGGVLQGVPRFFLRGNGGPVPHLIQIIAVVVISLLLWSIAVRRRQWSVWITASHMTLGLVLADVLMSALGMVIASIDTNGAFAEAIAREPLTFASSNLVLILIRIPLWFIGSATTIGLGRSLGGQSSRPPSSVARRSKATN